MEVVLGVAIGIITILGIAFSRWITTFFHELGHSLTALFLTSGKVEMYIAVPRDEAKKLKIRVGRLTFYWSWVIWHIDIGFTQYERSEDRWKNLLINVSGSLFSLVLGTFLFFLIIQDAYGDGLKFIYAVLLVSVVFDLFTNLVPRVLHLQLESRTVVKNDGQQLLDLFRKENRPIAYLKALDKITTGQYNEANELLDQLSQEEKKESYFFEAKLEILNAQDDPKAFIQLFNKYISTHNPTLKLVASWARAKIKLHDYDEVVEKLTNIIYEGKGNYDLYFLRGKALVELSEYNDAMRDFHALTLGAVEDPLALANRAYCQYRLGYEEEAREDVQQAIDHAKFENGEIYFLAGVIFENYDEEKALSFYKKAESLKYDHHALAFNISRIEKYK